jgi:hypothetical protein
MLKILKNGAIYKMDNKEIYTIVEEELWEELDRQPTDEEISDAAADYCAGIGDFLLEEEKYKDWN